MNNAITCDKCGAAMVPHDQERTTGMLCPKCGWGWVTTRYDPIAADQTDYEIYLLPGNDQSIKNIKLLSRIVNQSYIQSKKMLAENEAVRIYKAQNEGASEYCKAQRVMLIAKELQAANIRFRIEPAFPHRIE